MKLGIALSGGGARAAAHIGVLKALEEHSIKVSYIAGTSGGAIIGSLYANGLSIDELLEVAEEGSLFKIFKAGIPIKGLTSIDYLGEIIEKWVPHNSFSGLKIPFTAAATDLMSGQLTLLKSGNLAKSVMASCAIPLLFNPVEIENRLYADGGILDNMPVSSLKVQSDIVVGVNVMPNKVQPKKEINNMFNIGLRVFDVMIHHNSQINYGQCDLVIEPLEATEYNILNFSASEELFEIGYQAALSQIDELKNIINRFKTAQVYE